MEYYINGRTNNSRINNGRMIRLVIAQLIANTWALQSRSPAHKLDKNVILTDKSLLNNFHLRCIAFEPSKILFAFKFT